MNLSSPPAGALRAAVIGAGAGHAHWVSAGSAEPGRDGSVFVITAKTRLC